MEILRVENLTKEYSSNGITVRALFDINLKFEQGEFTVIAGPSGSGKTTLLNIIGSLDKPTFGKVYFLGEDLSQKNKSELSDLRLNKIGFIFQAYNLIPVLTNLENVEFPLMLLGMSAKDRKERAMRIMEELDIAELANKRPNSVSGGQQQRVAVARAIVHSPILVLADEPTANLDSKSASSLLDLMEKMNTEKNITFIFSSHDKNVIDRAKRLILLKDGMVVQDENK